MCLLLTVRLHATHAADLLIMSRSEPGMPGDVCFTRTAPRCSRKWQTCWQALLADICWQWELAAPPKRWRVTRLEGLRLGGQASGRSGHEWAGSGLHLEGRRVP